MTAVLIILAAALAAVSVLLIIQKREVKSISGQLRELRKLDTNMLIEAKSSSADELINEINSVLKQMRRMRIQYHQKNHALEQMITNISHDLRTPLTSAMGYLNIIRHSDLPDAEKKRELELVEKRLLRLEELINSFFELSKIVSRGEPPVLTELNLISVLEDSIVHYYDEFSSRKRQIIFQSDSHKYMIRSNQEMLLRIFDNLINNALKHGTGDLTVTVSAGETVTLTFTNQMTGFSPDIEQIFDEFYTTDISRTKGNTGLGLAIAKQFTQMLGGSISAAEENRNFIITVQFFHPA